MVTANDRCGVIDGSVKCNKPAVATLVNPQSSHRVCEDHAKKMEKTQGPHQIIRD